MATRPTIGYPKWATLGSVIPVLGELNKKQPDIAVQNRGIDAGAILGNPEINWQFDSISRWEEYLDTATYDLLIRVDALDGLGTTPVNIPPE
jgi:hypothetical protein